ncbi:ATP-binding protein [Kitasatospora sp. NBC_01539]|uniref:ATP-binding protein n=1 Tax=Kitasatospora sp. NBC_01539 TaxID=2903577 RepID=UPI003860272C
MLMTEPRSDFAADLTLPRHPKAAGQARRVVSAMDLEDQDLADRGHLLVTEAVANAIEHASGTHLQVVLARDERTGGLFAAVFDAEPARPVQRHVPAEGLAESGRGMALIRTLSEDWGCLAVGEGKWVWFHLVPTASAPLPP